MVRLGGIAICLGVRVALSNSGVSLRGVEGRLLTPVAPLF
jgi:hypothetical protein